MFSNCHNYQQDNKILSISNCKSEVEFSKQLNFKGINKSMEKLIIRHSVLTKEVLENLGRSLEGTNFSYLEISSSDVNIEGLMPLLYNLKYTKVDSLVLRWNKFSLKNAIDIVSSLIDSKVEHLDLGRNNFSEGDLSKLTSILLKTSIRIINLEWSQLNSINIENFSNFLIHNPFYSTSLKNNLPDVGILKKIEQGNIDNQKNILIALGQILGKKNKNTGYLVIKNILTFLFGTKFINNHDVEHDNVVINIVEDARRLKLTK